MAGRSVRPSPARFSLVAASKALRVRTPAYLLSAQLRGERWWPQLLVPGEDTESPCLTWIGVEDGRTLEPFRRMYLVSADQRAFEVRFDAEGSFRCHLSGAADTATLTVSLCGDADDASELRVLHMQTESSPTLRDRAVLIWPHCQLSIECTLGVCRATGGTVSLGSAGAIRELPGDAPMARGYLHAEMRLTVCPAP